MMPSNSGDVPISTNLRLPSYQPERVVHFLLGSHGALIDAINRMVVLGYCERIAWTNPIPTGRNGEYICLMSSRISPMEGEGRS